MPDDNSPHGCHECGYLQFRRKDTGELVSANRQANGRLAQAYDLDKPFRNSPKEIEVYEQWPICFKLKRDFKADFPQIYNPPPGYSAPDWQAMHEPYDCISFVRLVPGRTPREHDEMLDQKWKLEYEERRDAADKRFQIRMQRIASRREQSFEWKLARFVAVTAIVSAALSGLAQVAFDRLWPSSNPAPEVQQPTTINVPAQPAPIVNNVITLATPESR